MSWQTDLNPANLDRRELLGAMAKGMVAAGVSNLLTRRSASAAPASDIKPFRIRVPEGELADLRRRLAATKYPEREIVGDQSQGVQLATIKRLVRYWQTDHDWRKVEARLNALPQFTTIIDPLTNPTAHGASASDAFDLVIPSLPGHGFSGKPTELGWDPIRIARAWVVLMKRLGYTQFVAQGGDWGNAVTEQMALLAPPELLGIHTNMPATVPDNVEAALHGGPAVGGLSDEQKRAYDQLDFFYKHGLGYAQEMAGRPQTLYALADSPAGLAALKLDHDARRPALITP